MPTAHAFPKRIGEYEVQRWLGSGAYGNTYLVRGDAGQPLAMKWLREDAAANGAERFQNERAAMARVNHPAFPRLIANGMEMQRPYIVMSFGEGETIKKWIEEHIKEQIHFGGPRTLLVAQKLLEGLEYLHSIPLLHRDLKDDNVLVSASGDSVTILDLGQCKADFLPVQDITFWHIGASRYCPPAKFDEPSSFNISHDVFAVGVICYRMLTNNYPWEVPPGESAGHLKAQMLEKHPTHIRDFNNDVDDRIITLVMRMIDVEDYSRISSEDALQEIARLRSLLESDTDVGAGSGRPLLFPRVVRDSLHGDIQLTDLERDIISSKELQRLRYIKQLGTTHLVYPTAEHSRFSHVLGVLHVVERTMRSIELREGRVFEPDQRRAARMYALLHDVAHAPFGHTLEDELGFFPRHDHNQARLHRFLMRSGGGLASLLQTIAPGRVVLDLLFGNPSESKAEWIATLVDGPAGADVIDYIDRDSYNCGLDHRVDSAIYRWFTLDHTTSSSMRAPEVLPKLYGNHGFRLDADHALLSVLAERYALFLKVYTHPVKVAAGAMIGKALAIAMRDRSDRFYEEAIEQWTDEGLLDKLASSELSAVEALIGRYRDRRLYRPAFQSHVLPVGSLTDENYSDRQEHLRSLGLLDPVLRGKWERDLAAEADVSEDSVIMYASHKAPGASSVQQKVLRGRGRVAVRARIDKEHRDVFRRHLRLWQVYLFCPPELPLDKQRLLASLASRRLGMENEVAMNRRQLDLAI